MKENVTDIVWQLLPRLQDGAFVEWASCSKTTQGMEWEVWMRFKGIPFVAHGLVDRIDIDATSDFPGLFLGAVVAGVNSKIAGLVAVS